MEATQAMHSLFKIVQKLDLILSSLGRDEMVLNREMILLALDLKRITGFDVYRLFVGEHRLNQGNELG